MHERPAHASLMATPLDTSVVGSRVLVFDEVDSTNDRAMALGGHGTVVVADRQTAGRGRHGRPWHGAPRLGLWFSVAFERPIEGLPFAGPLAVRDALRPHCDCGIKWPNDLLSLGKKICGILVERRKGLTVLGVGLNVAHRTEDFPEELRDKATSLLLVTGDELDRGELLRSILTRLDDRVVALEAGGDEEVRREWAMACGMEGRRVRHEDTECVVVAIDRHGGLVLDTPHGARRVLYGERIEWMEPE